MDEMRPASCVLGAGAQVGVKTIYAGVHFGDERTQQGEFILI